MNYQTMTLHPSEAAQSRGVMTQALRYAAVLFASRCLILLALWLLTGGNELSNDTSMHMGMVRHPLSVLLDTTPGYQQNPPLLPFLETIAGYPMQLLLPDFLTLRFVMIGYEAILGALFYLLLLDLGLSARNRNLCLAAYVLLPMGWMTSTVMAQDEAIAAAAMLLPLVLFNRGREVAAILTCGLGIIAAKLFMGLELLTLIAISEPRHRLRYVLIGFAPLVLVYGGMTLHHLLHGLPLPLLGFRPDPTYGANFWMLLRNYAGVDLRAVGPYSGILALAASLTPAAILLYRRRQARTASPSALSVAIAVNTSLLIFFALFYHVNPEYFIMTMPLLLATARDRTDAAACILVATVPWAAKFFENAQFMAQADTHVGKFIALKYYSMIFHSSPGNWLSGSQLLFSVLIIAVSIRWCIRLARPQTVRAEIPGG
jgi:hypothetical protein